LIEVIENKFRSPINPMHIRTCRVANCCTQLAVSQVLRGTRMPVSGWMLIAQFKLHYVSANRKDMQATRVALEERLVGSGALIAIRRHAVGKSHLCLCAYRRPHQQHGWRSYVERNLAKRFGQKRGIADTAGCCPCQRGAEPHRQQTVVLVRLVIPWPVQCHAALGDHYADAIQPTRWIQ
jgi:hypothetical protein